MENKEEIRAKVKKSFLYSKWVPVAGLLLGILFLIGGSISSSFSKPKTTEDYTVAYYTDIMEDRIHKLCTSIHGITEAAVLLTLESGSEYVYAQNGSESTQVWDYVIVNREGEENPILVTEIYPKIRGVAVVCTNGNTIEVQKTITELLSAALGIPTHRIRVAGS